MMTKSTRRVCTTLMCHFTCLVLCTCCVCFPENRLWWWCVITSPEPSSVELPIECCCPCAFPQFTILQWCLNLDGSQRCDAHTQLRPMLSCLFLLCMCDLDLCSFSGLVCAAQEWKNCTLSIHERSDCLLFGIEVVFCQLLRLLGTNILVHYNLAMNENLISKWVKYCTTGHYCELILFLWNIIFTFYYTHVWSQCDFSILRRICCEVVIEGLSQRRIARGVSRFISVTGTAWRTLRWLCAFPNRVGGLHSLDSTLFGTQGDLIVNMELVSPRIHASPQTL